MTVYFISAVPPLALKHYSPKTLVFQETDVLLLIAVNFQSECNSGAKVAFNTGRNAATLSLGTFLEERNDIQGYCKASGKKPNNNIKGS
jgi:hypothetical protein